MRGRSFIVVAIAVTVALANPARPDAHLSPALRQYLDRPGFAWTSTQTKNFRIYFEAGSEASRYARAIEQNVEADRARVLRLLGAWEYAPTIHAFLLDSTAHMKELVGVSVHGRSRPAQHAVFTVATGERLHLTHEICHEVASNLWGAAEPWVEEGLATYADEGGNLYYDAWSLMNTESLIPMEKLVDPAWTSSTYSPDITYTQLGGFVKFLHDRYGVKRLKKVWKGGSVSIPAVYGKPLAELDREWRSALVAQFPEKPTRHYRTGSAGYWIE